MEPLVGPAGRVQDSSTVQWSVGCGLISDADYLFLWSDGVASRRVGEFVYGFYRLTDARRVGDRE